MNNQNQEQWNNVGNPVEKHDKTVKNIRYIISGVFALTGVIILASQLFPLAGSYLNGEIYRQKEENLAKPVPDDYHETILKDFGYDPGKSYFQNLMSQAGVNYDNATFYDPISKQLKKVSIDETYKKDMSLSIKSADIVNIKLQPNVPSYDETVYDQALKHGLAHFKGTPLPGDGGNSFIYGHSSIQSFFNAYPNNPEIVFSKLEKADVGASVEIEKDGKKLYYTVRKKKVVEADDFSILNPQGDKETVTLMTCWPLGIGTKRLVLIAERNE